MITFETQDERWTRDEPGFIPDESDKEYQKGDYWEKKIPKEPENNPEDKYQVN